MLNTQGRTYSGTSTTARTKTSAAPQKLPDEIINSQQFNQVIGAIIAGKYSWACVLLLYWANYNPLHYIPYRTYNRLMKENLHAEAEKAEKATEQKRQSR